jgi:hypothetical protein
MEKILQAGANVGSPIQFEISPIHRVLVVDGLQH